MSEARVQNKRVAVVLFGFAAGMVGLAYAAVPLYDLFCRVTGFGGTTQVASTDVGDIPVLDREMTIRFAGSTANGIPWAFKPVETRQVVRIGEQKLAFFEARNLADRTITGTASFNVTPAKAGVYFVKVDCFCFTEQTLAPGERVDMPVTYYVDPALAEDPALDTVKEIVLSYTFFEMENVDRNTLKVSLNNTEGSLN